MRRSRRDDCRILICIDVSLVHSGLYRKHPWLGLGLWMMTAAAHTDRFRREVATDEMILEIDKAVVRVSRDLEDL